MSTQVSFLLLGLTELITFGEEQGYELILFLTIYGKTYH